MGAALGTALGLLVKDLDFPSLVSYWGDRAPLVLLFVLLGAVLYSTRLWWLLWAGLISSGLLWLLVAFTPLTRALVGDLPRTDPLQKADAIFVLSSGLQEDGELHSVAMSRLLHGLTLLEEGWAPRLILSELPPPHASYARAARALMQSLGMKQELLTVGPVGNTHDEAVAIGELFRSRGFTKLLVVTSPVHAKRASAVLEKERIYVISSPAMETRYDLQTLRRPDDKIRAFSTIMHERIGLWVYRYRGWL